jgi:hypothetical protein
MPKGLIRNSVTSRLGNKLSLRCHKCRSEGRASGALCEHQRQSECITLPPARHVSDSLSCHDPPPRHHLVMAIDPAPVHISQAARLSGLTKTSSRRKTSRWTRADLRAAALDHRLRSSRPTWLSGPSGDIAGRLLEHSDLRTRRAAEITIDLGTRDQMNQASVCSGAYRRQTRPRS